MIIDSLDKTIQVKVVYYGPALSGKTTSIKALFNHFGLEEKITSIESSVRRTLFFDYGTIEFQNQRWLLKIHLYATTGQDFYIVTRPVTLKGIDGIIFVADSQEKTFDRNVVSWNELHSYFKDIFNTLPKVVCFNKQDLPKKYDPSTFLERVDFSKVEKAKVVPTIAVNGEGILESFEELLGLIFKDLYQSQLVSTLQ